MSERAQLRQAGSFGRVVEAYERGRPGYPEEAVRWLIGAGGRVVDLGAGTGKLTASLAEAASETIAVEPQHPMLLRLKEVVPGARTICARAEAVPIQAGWADVVTVGQAFHWFDRDRALPEIARVLRTGGHLGVVWNVRDRSVDWVAELERISGSDNSESTRGSMSKVAHFGPFESHRFRFTQVLDRDGLLAHVNSRSNVAAMDETDRRRVTESVLQLVEAHSAFAGSDRFEFPYITQAFRAEKA
ncbi:MAG: methyltransferase domain-containing protein [Actinobacteria bacterium]|nr:methyltransferase domain-containing protein [Actinomycetota bacterium]